MAEEHPKVSVGVPVYNGEKYLRAALDCLTQQTYDDLEIVISDNASTDRTPEICEEYRSHDERIRYIRQEHNQGIAFNFNETFRVARGQYFKWLPHDDVCDLTFIEKAVEVLDRNPDIVLCASKGALVDNAGELLPASGGEDGSLDPVLPGLRFDSGPPHVRFEDVLMNGVWGVEFYGLIRADVLRTTGLHPPYCLGEKVLLAELALRGRFFEIQELLLFWRHHSEQVSQTNSVSEQSKMAARPDRWLPPLPFRAESSLGYFAIIARSPLPLADKLRCLCVLGRYFMQFGKWMRVLREALTGRPNAGTLLRQAPSKN